MGALIMMIGGAIAGYFYIDSDITGIVAGAVIGLILRFVTVVLSIINAIIQWFNEMLQRSMNGR